MPGHYARATALSNVGGRIDYISSPERQEKLLAFHDSTAELLGGNYWTVLAAECRQSFEKFGDHTERIIDGKAATKKCCEGREIMQPLSNALLDRMEPAEIAKTISDTFEKELGLKAAVAVHYNKKENDLHAHIIFSEREMLPEIEGIKIAERNLFFNAEGKRVYKKSEILDENKELLPGCKIIKKGETYGEPRHFGSVDQKFSGKKWLQETKDKVLLPLVNGKLKGDVEFTKFDPTKRLATHHEGKGKEAPIIRQKNEIIRENNRRLEIMEQNGLDISGILKECNAIRDKARTEPEIMKQQGRGNRVPLILYDSNSKEFKVVSPTVEGAKELADLSKGSFEKEVYDLTHPAEPEQTADQTAETVVEQPETVQENPELDAGNAINAVNPPAEKVNDKKENHVEPSKERKGIFDRVREFFADKAAQRAAAAEKAAHWEPPERNRVYIPDPPKASDRLMKNMAEVAVAEKEIKAAYQQLTAAYQLPRRDKTKEKKQEYYQTLIKELENEKAVAFAKVEKSGVILREAHGIDKMTASTCSGENLEVLTQRVEQKAAELRREESPRKPSLQQTMDEAKESIAMQKYREHQKKIAPEVNAKLEEKAKTQSKSKGRDR